MNDNTAAPTDYSAWIMGDADLIEVDLRNLTATELDALRDDAGQAGDQDMIRTIDSILGR